MCEIDHQRQMPCEKVGRSLGFIWSVWSVWSFWSDKTNPMNQVDEIGQINSSRREP